MREETEMPPEVPAIWHAAIDGVRKGPMSIIQIGRLVQDGFVTQQSLVWKKGMADWIPAGQTPELTALFRAKSGSDSMRGLRDQSVASARAFAATMGLDDPKGTFQLLLDRSFSDFITVRIARLFYSLALALASMGAISILFAGWKSLIAAIKIDSNSEVVLAVLGTLQGIGFMLVMVLAARIWIEAALIRFRIAENAREAAVLAGRLVEGEAGQSLSLKDK